MGPNQVETEWCGLDFHPCVPPHDLYSECCKRHISWQTRWSACSLLRISCWPKGNYRRDHQNRKQYHMSTGKVSESIRVHTLDYPITGLSRKTLLMMVGTVHLFFSLPWWHCPLEQMSGVSCSRAREYWQYTLVPPETLHLWDLNSRRRRSTMF